MDNREEIKKLREKADKLEKEQNKFDLLGEDIKLAEIIHNKLCHWNHTDGCGWYYEKWENIKDGDNSTRGRYLEKAKKILVDTEFEVAYKIIRRL